MKIPCSSCNQRLDIPEELAGQTIECPACNKSLDVPAMAVMPPAPIQQSTPQVAASEQPKSSVLKWAAPVAIIMVVAVGMFVFYSNTEVKTDGNSKISTSAPETKPDAEAAKPEPPTVKAPDISIHRAVEDENIEAVKQHLAAGTDVNEHDSIQSPLHYAAQSYSKEIVDLLIANGADVNAKDRTGSPPLHWAVLKGQKDIVELLIEAGADMYVRKKRGGDNLLHIAALRGHKEVAEMLIVKGFDVNSRNDEEETPFYNTAFAGHAEVAKLFIEKGADVNAKDKHGETPLDFAHGVVATLLSHGAKTGYELNALIPRLVQHGQFAFSFVAKKGKVYEVQDSFDLLNWEVIKTYTGTGDSIRFDEKRNHDPPQWFYRVRVVE